jgi:hypothetical protein
MMKPLLRLLRLSQYGWAVIALVLSVAADGNAQSHEWLVGVWTGPVIQVGYTGSFTLTVREEGGNIKWMSVSEGRRNRYEAEGIVTRVDDSSAELEGKYIASTFTRNIGTGLKISVTRSSDSISALAMGERAQQPFEIKLTKGK